MTGLLDRLLAHLAGATEDPRLAKNSYAADIRNNDPALRKQVIQALADGLAPSSTVEIDRPTGTITITTRIILPTGEEAERAADTLWTRAQDLEALAPPWNAGQLA